LGFKEKEDVPYYYAIADIFIFASRYDGWALVINEAAAADLAIIASNKVGAAMDKIENEYNGYICDPEDVNGFYKYMMLMILDPSRRDQIIDNMRQLKETFSSGYNARLVNEICETYK
jgi:glycosyltransferase involved in cell wall biosynthesis